MSFRYAQIDADGIVLNDGKLSGIVEAPNMIPIPNDFDITNKKYINGEWIGYKPEPIEEPIPEQDQIQAEMLLNQCNILINQENQLINQECQDAVLAEILINQLGV